MNKVILMGRLTKDPELRYTGNNTPVATFTLAVDRAFQNNGQREADFINTVIWNKQAEAVKKFLTKGSKIIVEGRIQTRNYDDKDGKKVYVTEVVADRFEFCESKGTKSTSEFDDSYFGPTVEEAPTTNVSDEPYIDFGDSIELSDDDVAF